MYRPIQAYLDVIRPWCVGPEGEGWCTEDFTDAVMEAREEFTQTVFPLVPYPISDKDKQVLDGPILRALFSLNQWISSFNEVVRRVNETDTYGKHEPRMIEMLHVGVIGRQGTGGLFDAFRAVENLAVPVSLPPFLGPGCSCDPGTRTEGTCPEKPEGDN